MNGLRIEVGEIEALLRAHPSVSDGVVIAAERAPGDVRLVAYAVGRPDLPVTPAELRRQLSEHLPRALVPAVPTWSGFPSRAERSATRSRR